MGPAAGTGAAALTCQICNLRVSGGLNFQQHLLGSKHRRAAAAAALSAVTDAVAAADPAASAGRASEGGGQPVQVTYVGPQAATRDYCTQASPIVLYAP